MGSFLKFGGIISFLVLVLLIMRNEMMIYQLILFHKSNKNSK
jgi:hypothetical protein